jgi:hypothetical protein
VVGVDDKGQRGMAEAGAGACCGARDAPLHPWTPLRLPPLRRRRDYALLLLHAGRPAAARRELRAYMTGLGGWRGPSYAAGGPAQAQAQAQAQAGGSGPDAFDVLLCRRLLEALEELPAEAEGEGEVLRLESALAAPPPWERRAAPPRALPLTW